jgi:hypothetical protein
LFDPLKNLLLSGRGTDCRASYIAGRCVMQDFKVLAADTEAMQAQAQRQFGTLLESHAQRMFRDKRTRAVITPVFPSA